MIHFDRPEALLLGLVALFILRRHLLGRPTVTALRVLLLLALLILLAGPRIEGRTSGRDLVLLVDRSRSMPASTLDTLRELAEAARTRSEPGDRIGLVAFGREAVVEQAPSEAFRYVAPTGELDADATDLAEAMETALALIPPERQGSLLILSDGEVTGRDPSSAARHALRRGLRVDVAVQRRPGVFDLAVEEVSVPGEVALGEPFQACVWVRADRALDAPIRVQRGGVLLASGMRSFRAGLNCIRFRDRALMTGIATYDVQIDAPEDRVPENDRARAAVRVTGPFRVLCVTPDGRQDRLTRSLAAAGVSVDVVAPHSAPLGPNRLDGYRAVVLEDVPLEDLPRGADDVLATYVRDLGGGLLMTGGRASFGPGGYHQSAIESVLPVSMEIRQEQRKFFLAMAIALDRSGSMSMPVASGESKMDLANRGACAAVELLGRGDAVSVIAVDSAPHIVVPLVSLTDKPQVLSEIRKIESMGGGIYTYTALVAAAQELAKATQGTRHIVLFADAQDAEEPGDYKTFVPGLRAAGVTVSVIGLGSDTDVDADFLRDVAHLGGGRCFFAADAADLPRVFAQETIQVARSSIVEEATAVAQQPALVSVGALQGQGFPRVGGYSIAYLKGAAQAGLVTRDDTAAPLLSFWQHGLGRSAAYLGIADGALSGEVGSWEGYADFFATVVRWTAGTEAAGELFADFERRGHEGILSVEVPEGRDDLLAGLSARILDPGGEAREVRLVRVDDTRMEARIALRGEGLYRPVLETSDGRFLRLPAATLPYSPEFEPRTDPQEGEKLLQRLARIAEGRVDPPMGALMAGSRESRGARSLAWLLAWLALALLLLEIAVRRLGLRVPTEQVQTAWAKRPRMARRPRVRTTKVAPTKPPAVETTPKAVVEEDASPPSEETDGIASVLDRARRKGRRR